MWKRWARMPWWSRVGTAGEAAVTRTQLCTWCGTAAPWRPGWAPPPTSRPPPTARASGYSPGRTQPAASSARSGSTVGRDGRRGPRRATPSLSTSYPPGCSSTAPGPATGAAPTAPWPPSRSTPARSPEQTLDVWLLDIASRGWRRLPDMPLRLGPSKPQLRWTPDGRLVLLAEPAGESAAVVAVWRPGQSRIAARRVQLPDPERGGGYRFAIW
jgi:hypothetical protein